MDATVTYTQAPLPATTVSLSDILGDSALWLPADFKDRTIVTFNTLLGEQQETLADIEDGNIRWLPKDFADVATVTFANALGATTTATLADIEGGRATWLPSDFNDLVTVTFETGLGASVTVTATLADIYGGRVDWLPDSFNDMVRVDLPYLFASQPSVTMQDVLDGDVSLVDYMLLYWNTVITYQQHEGILPDTTRPVLVDEGRVTWNPSSTGPQASDALPYGLVTVPDGAVFQIWTQQDGWRDITADAAPDRDGQQVQIDLAEIRSGVATMRLVLDDGRIIDQPFTVEAGRDGLLSDSDGTRVKVNDEGYVTVKVRVFDGTDLSSVERDIRIHVEAVNDAPTARTDYVHGLSLMKVLFINDHGDHWVSVIISDPEQDNTVKLTDNDLKSGHLPSWRSP